MSDIQAVRIPDLMSRRVLVTGGSTGIGAEIVRGFAAQGAQVALHYNQSHDAALALQAEFPEHIFPVQGDMSVPGAPTRVVKEAARILGGLDGLINNAGIANPHVPNIEDLEWDQWQRVINVNLGGAFLATKHATQHLRDTKGAIVNIASTRAFQSEANTEPYAASKGGIVALTHALAVSLAGNIRVNAIAPGWIEVGDWQKNANKTEPDHSEADKAQHPVGRVGTPKDIAQAVSFLLDGDKSGFMTGETIRIDGGMTHKMIYVD